jgi:CBS domain-containing protein
MGSSTTLAKRLLRDVMTSPVDAIRPDTTIREAAERMKHLNVGAMPVCDGERLEGIVTDRDIVLRIVAARRDVRDATVRDAMTADAAYCYDDQTVEEAARVMGDKQIRRLPILSRERKLVGIVSLGDLAVDGEEPMTGGKALRRISTQSPARHEASRTNIEGSTDPQA